MVSRGTTLTVAAVVALLVGVAGGYLVRGADVSSLQDQLSKSQASRMMLQEEMQNLTAPVAFKGETGQMIHDAWLLVSSLGNGKYVIAVHAEGLDHPSAQGAYLVEGVTRTAIQMLPVGVNASASEFEAGTNGIGEYSVIVNVNPNTTFEKVELLFLPGMSMEQAVLVATATIG